MVKNATVFCCFVDISPATDVINTVDLDDYDHNNRPAGFYSDAMTYTLIRFSLPVKL